jgi:hypothetical protein
MITLAPNSSSEQFIYLTLQEAKKDVRMRLLNYLVIFTSMASLDTFAMVGMSMQITHDIRNSPY